MGVDGGGRGYRDAGGLGEGGGDMMGGGGRREKTSQCAHLTFYFHVTS